MTQNMGKTDRIVRILAAAAIIILYFMGGISGTLGIILLVFAAIFIGTSAVGFCPLYYLLGISTKKHEPFLKT